MMGCFEPLCGCVDSAIHTQAGLQLRADCYHFMMEQGHAEPAGGAKITYAYNLPARYVIHTVGPCVDGAPTARDRELLASCYRSSLRLAGRHRLASVAFPCISTGHGGFPAADAARVALDAIRSTLRDWGGAEKDVDAPAAPRPKVVLVCHTEEGYEAYRALL